MTFRQERNNDNNEQYRSQEVQTLKLMKSLIGGSKQSADTSRATSFPRLLGTGSGFMFLYVIK